MRWGNGREFKGDNVGGFGEVQTLIHCRDTLAVLTLISATSDICGFLFRSYLA